MGVLELRDEGLYCPAGGFHIDPGRGVELAVVTHGHSDHCRKGSQRYLTADSGVPIVRHRLGSGAEIEGLPFGQQIKLGQALVSLHPAGHLLGSAQVRVEVDGEVWVASGDYKRAPDPSCEPFEVVPCDVFITEATFALPVYRWEPGPVVARDIIQWWDEQAAAGRAALLYGYSLGKAQRLLAELGRLDDRPIWIHESIAPFNEIYRAAGVELPDTPVVQQAPDGQSFAGALVIAASASRRGRWRRRLGPHQEAFASGWMRLERVRRERGFGRGFVLSDHADWPNLLQTIEACGARRVLVTHGREDVLVRVLRDGFGVVAEPLEVIRAGAS